LAAAAAADAVRGVGRVAAAKKTRTTAIERPILFIYRECFAADENQSHPPFELLAFLDEAALWQLLPAQQNSMNSDDESSDAVGHF
jgi:hypothetical protein